MLTGSSDVEPLLHVKFTMVVVTATTHPALLISSSPQGWTATAPHYSVAQPPSTPSHCPRCHVDAKTPQVIS